VNNEEDEKPPSVVYDHCKAVYNEMVSQARDEGDDGLVYEGHLTKLFAQLQLSTPYYTAVRKHLMAMECIVQLRRGGGSSSSRWRLLREPDEDSFRSFETLNRARSGKTAALEQQVRDLNRRVSTLEQGLQMQHSMFRDLEAKFQTLATKYEGMHNHLMANEVLT
jgi:hypothetical protein